MTRTRMTTFFVGFYTLYIGAVSSLPAGEREAVLKLEGCSGFLVEGNLLVTAKHCQPPEHLTVSLQGKLVPARRVFLTSEEDGPVVYRLPGGPYPSLPVANAKPEPGDAVYSLGYPGGNWARLEGRILGGNGKDTNYTNHRIATGNSGGPLLNARGEVVGVALFVAEDLDVHRSGFSGWRVTVDAIRQASGVVHGSPTGPQIVVFVTENCAACRTLKQDVRAGHFSGYSFQFVNWDASRGRWSHPELYQAYVRACHPATNSVPAIWIRGTSHYRVGYSSSKRVSLLSWIAGVVRQLWQGLVGVPESSPLPEVRIPETGTPETAPEKTVPDSSTRQLLKKLQTDLATLRTDASQTREAFQQFQESGVVGKIRAIAHLKSEKEATLAHVADVKSDVTALKGEFRERPLQFLWGLFGIVTGLLHRRFAN